MMTSWLVCLCETALSKVGTPVFRLYFESKITAATVDTTVKKDCETWT